MMLYLSSAGVNVGISSDDFKKNASLVSLLFIILLLCIVGIKILNWIALDDAYITYRYARNIATGIGFVYNSGQLVLSTTTPLFAVVLAGSYLVSHDLRLNSIIIGVLFLMVSIVAIYAIFSKEKTNFAYLLAAALVLSNIMVYYSMGMETSFFLALILLSLYAYMRKKFGWTGLFLGLATLTRIDALLLVASIGAHYLFINRKNLHEPILSRDVLRLAAVFALVLVPWLIFSMLYFGSPLPLTLKSKIVHYESGIWISATNYLISVLLAQYLILIPLFAIGCGFILTKYQQYLPILFYMIAYSAGYMFLPNYVWYLVPPMTMFFIISALGLTYGCEFLYRQAVSRFHIDRRIALGSLLVFGLVLSAIALYAPATQASGFIGAHLEPSDIADHRLNFYKYIGEELAAETPANATVGSVEIGILGWYSDREIIDYCGLLQPDIIDHFQDDSIGDLYSPDYILFTQNFNGILPTYLVLNYSCVSFYNISGEEWSLLKREDLANTNRVTHIIAYVNRSALSRDAESALFAYVGVGNCSRFAIREDPVAAGENRIYVNNVPIGENDRLKFSISLYPAVFSPEYGDGVGYRIYIDDQLNTTLIYDGAIDPKNNAGDRRWNDREVDISQWEGKNVTFIFATTYMNSPTCDWAFWGDPVLIDSRS